MSAGMVTRRTMAGLLAAGLAFGRAAASPPPDDDLRVVGNPVIELAPMIYAIRRLGAARAGPGRGGIQSLFGPNAADLAGHAETQALRYSQAHPDLRIILTVTEGHYRIVGRRSAGIRRLSDLRGKTVAVPEASSAAYYFHRALATAGMREADMRLIDIPMPPKGIAALLADGKADAVALWDPEPQLAIDRLGRDAIILDPPTGGYREYYNLNTTAAKLADPVMRAKIVRFVAALIRTSAMLRRDAATGIALAAEGTGYPVSVIRPTWPHHTFPATLPPQLLDTMVAEEQWLARHEGGRTPRGRADLARLLDFSVEVEARALLRRPLRRR